MGRADVLYCLAGPIGLPHSAAARLLDGIDLTQDTRPLSEQIVDKIIAGDTERYELFMQVMRQAGPRNPYNASDEVTVHRARGAALFGEFLSLWVALERGLLAGPLAGLSEPEQEELDWLRALQSPGARLGTALRGEPGQSECDHALARREGARIAAPGIARPNP